LAWRPEKASVGGGLEAQAAAAGLQGRREPLPHSQPSLSWTQLISLPSLGPDPPRNMADPGPCHHKAQPSDTM